jgi:hypothetical protein
MFRSKKQKERWSGRKPERRKSLLSWRASRAADLDREIQSLVDNFLEIEVDLSTLGDVSARPINRNLLKINADRALRSALMRIAAVLAGKFDDVDSQCRLVIGRRRNLPLRRPMLT